MGRCFGEGLQLFGPFAPAGPVVASHSRTHPVFVMRFAFGGPDRDAFQFWIGVANGFDEFGGCVMAQIDGRLFGAVVGGPAAQWMPATAGGRGALEVVQKNSFWCGPGFEEAVDFL